MINNHQCKHAKITELRRGLRATLKSCPHHDRGLLVASSFTCSRCRFYTAFTIDDMVEAERKAQHDREAEKEVGQACAD